MAGQRRGSFTAGIEHLFAKASTPMGGRRKEPGLGNLWNWRNFTAELAAEVRERVPDVYAMRAHALVSWEFRRRRALIDARFTPWQFEVRDESGARVVGFEIARSDGFALEQLTEAIVTHIDLRRRNAFDALVSNAD